MKAAKTGLTETKKREIEIESLLAWKLVIIDLPLPPQSLMLHFTGSIKSCDYLRE